MSTANPSISSPPTPPHTMSLVVQLGTTVCSNNLMSNQQASPLPATAVASPDKPNQFPTSADLGTSIDSPNPTSSAKQTTDAQLIPLSQQACLVSQIHTLYKKAIGGPSSTIQGKLHPGNNGQRIQTLNLQRPSQLSHIAPQSKVQVLSNVVVPKHANYVLNKAPMQPQRQILNNTTKTIISAPAMQKSPGLNVVNSKAQLASKPQILNNIAKTSNYITATTVQNTPQLLNNTNRTIVTTASNKIQPQSQTHVISRVITPAAKPTQSVKINSTMVVQRSTNSTGGIKTIPPQSPGAQLQKLQGSARMQNNMVVQQRSGIKTIPPQRPSTYSKSVQKTVSNVKQNNFIVKNNAVPPRVQHNLVSPKAKQQIIVQANQTQSSRLLAQPGNIVAGNVVKYHGQQFQVIHTSNTTGPPSHARVASPPAVQQPPVTVLRTVASYEDNNVPTGIANTLFSPTTNSSLPLNKPKDEQDVSQDTYLSEDDSISEVRPDYTNCTNPVLFDHNYHLPPPDSPPPSPVKQTPTVVETPVVVHNGSLSDSPQVSPTYMYNSKVPTRLSFSNSSPHRLGLDKNNQDDDAGSTISSDAGREIEPEGEETETAPEGEGDEDSITRCICDFEHDDGYMICCDKCFVWQHVDCMFMDRQNIQEEYLCERCEPRRVDRQRARAIQLRKREEILNNGSSSDTSSGSSSVDAVNTINNNIPTKKRQTPVVGTPVASTGSRRKSEPIPPTAQRSRSTSLTTQRRSRRDSNREPPISAMRKGNTVTKRRQDRKIPTKRKTKNRRSQDTNDDSQESWERGTSSTSVLQLRQWIENYEEAVTNHYSPELRARIMKTSGHSADAKPSNLHALAQASLNVHKCRTTPQPNLGTKILLSTMYLTANTPIIELRGKYMLGSPQPIGNNQPGILGRHHAQRPGPFLFFYRLAKDSVEVCVDTRTYGNDARFVRRSCKPNTEVRHCIEKGTLHLYLVSINAIDKNTELTIKHEPYSLVGGNPVVSCACGNPLQCSVGPQHGTTRPNTVAVTTTPPSMVTRRSNGAVHDLVELNTQRKRRGRRTTSSSEAELPSPTPTSKPTLPVVQVPQLSPVAPVPRPQSPPIPEVIPPTVVSPPTTSQGPVRRSSQNSRTPVVKLEEKIEPSGSSTEKNEDRDIKDKKKMTREERKMEAIMKAFERLEKQQQRKQESKTRQVHRRESDPPPTQQNDGMSDQRSKRKKRKGRSRTISTNSNTSTNPTGRRRTRLNSTDSYVTSGDDSSLMSPPLPIGENDSNTTPNCVSNDIDLVDTDVSIQDEHEMEKTAIQDPHMSTEGHAAGLLLALANGGQHAEDHLKSPIRDADTCSSAGSVQSSPGTPVSSNCLLVAAAVEQITPGFKFPKTKKAIMNEWLNKSPEPVQTASSISSISLQIPRPIELPSPLSVSTPLESSSLGRQSLATLVHAANMCSSSPTIRPAGGNAKKRWLRQAISEECDSPNSRPESPHAEMIAPPKKRRMARESMSSEQSFTPPTTPTRPGNHVMSEEYENDNYLNQEDDYYNEEKTIQVHEFVEESSNKSMDVPNTEPSLTVVSRIENSKDSIYPSLEQNGHMSPNCDGEVLQKEKLGDILQNKMLDSLDGTEPGLNSRRGEEVTPPVTPIMNTVASNVDPRLRYESPHCLGRVEETLQLLESWGCTPKAEAITPAKRKLSISEYRQRKQQVGGSTGSSSCNEKGLSSIGGQIGSDGSISAPDSPRPLTRTRTNSASSGTSSLSSDDEQKEIPNSQIELHDKDKGVTVAFNSAPTLVERQRENLTARLKREFGLFLPEDEEAKKALAATTDSLLGQRLSLRSNSNILSTTCSEEQLQSPQVIPTLSGNLSSQQTGEEKRENNVEDVQYPTNNLKFSSINSSMEPSVSQMCSSPIAQLQNGLFKNIPSVNFITPFDNPVYPNTTYYTGFRSGKSPYLATTTDLTPSLEPSTTTSSTFPYIKSSSRK